MELNVYQPTKILEEESEASGSVVRAIDGPRRLYVNGIRVPLFLYRPLRWWVVRGQH